MVTVAKIERAILNLPSKELARFRTWFDEFDAEVWDKQFKEDVRKGRIRTIAKKAIVDFRKGKFREL